jgi:hypothetical protein
VNAIYAEGKEPHELLPGEWSYFHGEIYAYCPVGRHLIANLASHNIVIEEPMTLTVSPSILCQAEPGNTWHGYIENGVWLDENKRPIEEPK